MFGCRTAIGVGCCALALAWAFGCGGATEHGGAVGASGSTGQGGSATPRAGSSTGGSSDMPSAGKPGSGGSTMDAGPIERDPVDSGCAPQDLPPPQMECDPFVAGSCPPDSGCYPFVDHPEGSGCEQQVYGTLCLPAGTGKQGDLCGDEAGTCAPGFVCVVGQRAGKRCAALCKLGGVNQCSGGLICGDLDVPGYGVCG